VCYGCGEVKCSVFIRCNIIIIIQKHRVLKHFLLMMLIFSLLILRFLKIILPQKRLLSKKNVFLQKVKATFSNCFIVF